MKFPIVKLKLDLASLQTYHVYSTLKRRGSGRFYVVSTWNTRGVFGGDVIRATRLVLVSMGRFCNKLFTGFQENNLYFQLHRMQLSGCYSMIFIYLRKLLFYSIVI